MQTRHGSLYLGWLGAIGCWLGVAWGCSPEYELLRSGQPAPTAGNVSSDAGNPAPDGILNGGAGNASSADSGSGGVEAVAAGGESVVGGEDAGGSAAGP